LTGRWGLALLVLVAGHGSAAASVNALPAGRAYPLALLRVEGGTQPELVIAQRAIEREWPTPGDPGVRVVAGERSELGAMALSAAVPGAGQAYAGSLRGLYFAAAEVAGWVGWMVLRNRGDDLRDEARALVGSPEDSASAWSFDRFEGSGQGDADYLRALYAADLEAFEDAIARDPRYAAGWATAEAQAQFSSLRQGSDRRFSQSRIAEGALWVNHVVAALDALRAARLHNLPLRSGFELKANGGWRGGRPGFVVAVERRF
jgi:hypothetical protein